MFCLSNLSTIKPIVANATLPQNNDSDQTKPSIPVPATKSLPRRNRLRNGAPKPSVMQMERIVGAGSFRDTEPPPLRDSDMRKTVMDLFFGQAMEGEVQKKMRETGEWLSTNAEPRITSSSEY
ncbi:hypothetical protein JHK82_018849 [Glycine max]|uniref:NAD(P)H dehydrogenase subunit CRR3, chloroplastic n=1 Tax=Glycine soja TaxID=3848 RepID=A0A0B2QUB1_GLYSO|nr:hypothetical protein JHK86_018873 [Glycine max]KAG5143154.1 hypothetical protein JHK82_018849 [Glycine max]KHN23222.1 hypothetical protein glysoja_049932 [Glycine soja]